MATADGARERAERRGHAAEARAALWLRLKGWRILARRFRTPVGEVDLIAKRFRTIAFVEVKARAAREAGIEAITPSGQARIVRAAEAWLSRHPRAEALTLRFDIVVVRRRRLPIHIANAFTADGR